MPLFTMSLLPVKSSSVSENDRESNGHASSEKVSLNDVKSEILRSFDNGLSTDHSTTILASIFIDLEQLWKDIALETNKLEEFRSCLEADTCSSFKKTDSVHQIQQEYGSPPTSELPSNETNPVVEKSPISSEHTCRHEPERRRKSHKPTKSATRHDPNFRGVTVRMKTKVRGNDSRLVIMSSFASKKSGRSLPVRCRRNSGGLTDSESDSDIEDNAPPPPQRQPYLQRTGKIHWRLAPLGSKMCHSCGTRKTPLWRDAEDGTPLCNACGIRYKKYRVRCGRCWHIPKKDGKSYPHCPCCGALLSVSCKRNW